MAEKSTLGSRLRELRKRRQPKLTQAEAAEEIGISRSHLTKLELDQDPAGRETLAAIATYYGVTMDYLEFGADSGGLKVSEESFHRDDQRAWLAFGMRIGGDAREALVDFAGRTFLGGEANSSSRATGGQRRHKK